MKPGIFTIKRLVDWKHADALFLILACADTVAAIIAGACVAFDALGTSFIVLLVIYTLHAVKHVKKPAWGPWKKNQNRAGKQLSPDKKRIRAYWK
nr:hypothetical protein [Candidatus Sigynarchaeota archaeon]